MKSLLNVLILKWGKTNNGYEFIRQPVKFPKERAVTVNFDNREVVGKANKFRATDEGIICNVVFDKKISDTLAPSLTFYDSVKFGLTSVSFVNEHLCEDLNNNLRICYD